MTKGFVFCVAGFCMGSGVAFCGAYPALVGNGVADDTQAIQARLDGGGSCVYLPPPEKEYLISRTLGIDSPSRVENLTIRDCRMVNRLSDPIDFILNRGHVDELVTENNTFVGDWRK